MAMARREGCRWPGRCVAAPTRLHALLHGIHVGGGDAGQDGVVAQHGVVILVQLHLGGDGAGLVLVCGQEEE